MLRALHIGMFLGHVGQLVKQAVTELYWRVICKSSLLSLSIARPRPNAHTAVLRGIVFVAVPLAVIAFSFVAVSSIGPGFDTRKHAADDRS